MFKIIVITKPEFFEGETELVNQLFEAGMERLHLRKPKATIQEMAEWIERIAQPFRHLIVLHDHHSLARKYNLGGVHLNGRNPEKPDWVTGECGDRRFTVSRSCHAVEEVRRYKGECDYLFLSPIFDSISKEGYGAAFSRETLDSARREGLLAGNVLALGGISLGHLPEVAAMGFAGAAVLGDLWQGNPMERITSYRSFQTDCLFERK